MYTCIKWIWVGPILRSTSSDGAGSGSARSRLEDIAMARRRPNILDYCNSTVPAKRIHRDEGPESQ